MQDMLMFFSGYEILRTVLYGSTVLDDSTGYRVATLLRMTGTSI
jgi:hypothetical protein